jgi:murein DD-endopeptidase MepM/ murein hydrolase activator NlpD
VNRPRWTILVVPHGSDSPRQYELGERAVRLIGGALAGAGLLVLAAVVVLFSPWTTPGARILAYENQKLEHEVERMDVALAQLGDSIAVLANREQQFRELTGIAMLDSVPATPADAPSTTTVPVSRASMDARPRPFAAFFGNRDDRPDVNVLLQQAADLSERFAMVSDSMAVKIERLRNTPSIMPTRGWLSGAFSKLRLHPILHELRPHEGIDLSAPMGSPIIAPARGTVTRVRSEAGYGNALEIDHGNGIVTLYAHCSRIIVRVGQRVDRGQMIATVGNTGLSVGPHLHYEIHVNGRPVNPLTYVLPESGGP